MANKAGVRIEFDVRGVERAIARMHDCTGKINHVIMDALILSANRLRTRAVRGMQRTRTDPDRKYKRTKSGKYHYASYPKQYPAIDKGGLVRSLIVNARRDRLEAEMGSAFSKLRSTGDKQYPIFLEEGTGKMEPRPWLRPTVDREQGWIERTIYRAVREAGL